MCGRRETFTGSSPLNRITRFLVGALLYGLLAGPAAAQVLLYPGHPDLTGAGLIIGGQLSLVRVVEPSAKDVGTETTTVRRQGETVTVETAGSAPSVGVGDEVAFTLAWPSLRPVETRRGDKSLAVYDGTHMTGAFVRGDWDPLPYDITLDSEPFQPEVGVVAQLVPSDA